MIRAALLLALAASLPAAAQPRPASAIPGCTVEAARSRQPLPHGCATALNLEAMLADPSDLAGGRILSPPVGEPVVAPVRRHRMGRLPEPSDTSTTGPDR